MLREDAIKIWKAGVAAVDSARLVRSAMERSGNRLRVGDDSIRLDAIGRIAVVGAGKAGAGMAAAVEECLGSDLLAEKVTGWVNVPADCVRPLQKIVLHAARPAGRNEPTEAGVRGARRILQIVAGLNPRDLCLVLLSGGGSALLPAPAPGITLDDKLKVTRLLMESGATIQELNCVRKQLSAIKGGKLARACRAGRTIVLIISDVVGDPLDVIASGPTVPDPSTPQQALDVLRRYARRREDVPESVWNNLADRARHTIVSEEPFPDSVHNLVIGNNRTAIDACAAEAQRRGYLIHSLGSDREGEAKTEGRELAELCRRVRDRHRPLPPPACLLSGGEPVVHLAKTDRPRKGGRNQELVLAAVAALWDDGMDRIAVLSGGTDGEDGPTDAAGAVADKDLIVRARGLGLRPEPFLVINDSYPFFERSGGLLKTGPTHTNVMDVRVALVGAG